MTGTRPPSPATPPRETDLPHALTFFLTAAERRSVLARLRRTHPDRAAALLIRLRLRPRGARTTGGAR